MSVAITSKTHSADCPFWEGIFLYFFLSTWKRKVEKTWVAHDVQRFVTRNKITRKCNIWTFTSTRDPHGETVR